MPMMQAPQQLAHDRRLAAEDRAAAGEDRGHDGEPSQYPKERAPNEQRHSLTKAS
jgi:hypothetical protein